MLPMVVLTYPRELREWAKPPISRARWLASTNSLGRPWRPGGRVLWSGSATGLLHDQLVRAGEPDDLHHCAKGEVLAWGGRLEVERPVFRRQRRIGALDPDDDTRIAVLFGVLDDDLDARHQ